MDLIAFIESWYRARCDGDWEHQKGIRIETLDNPGWLVQIDLEGTPMESVSFDRVHEARSEDDWVDCQVVDGQYRAAGGPNNLRELLQVFRSCVRD